MRPARSACVTAQRGCVEAQEPTFAIMAARRTAWGPQDRGGRAPRLGSGWPSRACGIVSDRKGERSFLHL